MKLLKIILLILAVGIPIKGLGKQWPQAKVTVKVIEEDGSSVEGATVHINFMDEKVIRTAGPSDKEGFFTETKRTQSMIGFSAEKDGYYDTKGYMEVGGGGYVFMSEKNGKWQPWNPTLELVLKKKINPIAMYVKEVDGLVIPKLDEPVGYDLCIGDWVEPYGKGKAGDFIFTGKNDFKSADDRYYELRMTFSNPEDGIQPYFARDTVGSEFIFPHEAPDKGYNQIWMEWSYAKGEISSHSPGYAGYPNYDDGKQINYIFRVRTTKLPDGTVTGLYGKIRGPNNSGGGGKYPIKLNLTYYLNPTGTRNLEYKPGWNIFDWQKPWVRFVSTSGEVSLVPPERGENFPP